MKVKFELIMTGNHPSDSYSWGVFNNLQDAKSFMMEKKRAYPRMKFEIIRI